MSFLSSGRRHLSKNVLRSTDVAKNVFRRGPTDKKEIFKQNSLKNIYKFTISGGFHFREVLTYISLKSVVNYIHMQLITAIISGSWRHNIWKKHKKIIKCKETR